MNLRTAVLMLPTPTATPYGSNRGGANPDGPERAGLGTLARRGELLPAPTVCGNYNRKGASAQSGDGLATAVMLRTPNRNDGHKWNSHSQEAREAQGRQVMLSNQVGGGLLNPEFVERMMGWPANWTRINGATGASGMSTPPSANSPTAPPASKPSATAKSRSVRRKRSGSCASAEDGEV